MPEGAVAVAGYASGRVRVEATQIKADGGPLFPRLEHILSPKSSDVLLTRGSLDSITRFVACCK